MLQRLLIFSLIAFTTLSAQAQVWVDTNTWSPAWEERYVEWVRSSWQADIFARRRLPDGRTNPYYGMRADCADTVYSMRIIFAYENSLPFAALDPTGSGRLITNRMTRYNSIANRDERFRQFLWHIYGTLATVTLPNDTYPIALNQQTVRPGVLILTTRANHHSWTVKDILAIGVPWLVFNSTIGSDSGPMLQERQSWPNPYWVFEGNHTPQGNAGFRAWRPLEHIGRPVWEVPGYSEEQYRIPLERWQKTAQQRLATRQETDEQMLNRLTQTACTGLQGRVTAVQEGVSYLSSSGGRCMDYPTYDIYSTPNRDQRVFDDLVALRMAYKDIMKSNGGASVSQKLRQSMNKIFPAILKRTRDEAAQMGPQAWTADSICAISYRAGQKIDMAEAKRRLFAGLMSNNPHDDLEYRWGEKRGPSPRARSCPSWDPWSPDLESLD